MEGCCQELSEQQRAGIEAVATDMWTPYLQATLARVPEAAAKIVFDRFHVMGYLGKAKDTVRKQLRVGRAWTIEEPLRRPWHYVYRASRRKFWKRCYFRAPHGRLQSNCKAPETIHRHIDNILTC